LQSPIYVTCTADEEIGYGGAAAVAARSRLFAEMVQGNSRGVIGEPTCLEVVYAHKGVAGFRAVSHGLAAHSSTDKGINANLKMIPFLQEMLAIHHETAASPAWKNPEFDPPGISWNIGINDFTLATNITPGRSVCTVYFRPMPGMSADALFDRARRAADACGLEFQATVRGDPVYVDPRSPFIQEVLRLAGKSTPRTVSYGTDGAKLTSLKQLVVLGPGDIAQAHTDDEWIALEALEQGTDLYRRLIRHWCG
jgi:acetylornithine deacetylase